jgi:hypothetical protein
MNGLIFYRGKSELDGENIVGVAVGLDGSSGNRKTGDLIQTYIFVDNGHFPHENAAYGRADKSICGNCPHRAKEDQKAGSCYVNLGQGPYSVFKQLLQGKYDVLKQKHKPLFMGRYLRLGSYGDPAAIPFNVWAELSSWSTDHTGYTHQWRTCNPLFKNLCMASCDSLDDMTVAKMLGWRTFRVKQEHDASLPNEIRCPAQKGYFPQRQCQDCMACNGVNKVDDKRRDIVINVHGPVYKVKRFSLL